MKRIFLVLSTLMCLFALMAGCAASSGAEKTAEKIEGTWIYEAEDGSYRYIYSISGGCISQQAVAYDREGNAHDLSLGSTHQLKTIMREHCDRGGAIFFSTHVLEVAEKLCDKVAIIKGGRLIASGTMDEVKGDQRPDRVS